jgi:hypothetical protein
VIIGQIGRLETITTHTTRTVGLNALARGFAGRASVTGGGGIGYFFYHRRSEQIVTDCESSSPAVCQNSESTHEWQSFSVQGLAGVDVPIGPVIAAFGQFKVVTPVRDVTASHFSTTGGIRVKIW